MSLPIDKKSVLCILDSGIRATVARIPVHQMLQKEGLWEAGSSHYEINGKISLREEWSHKKDWLKDVPQANKVQTS